jgi:acylphosphatase
MGLTRNLRKEVHYSGHVQGVGFRYTMQQIARDFEVTGFVQNLSDGRVLLVVEAEAAEMKRFLREVEVRLGDYIHDVAESELAASCEFTGFSIRHSH